MNEFAPITLGRTLHTIHTDSFRFTEVEHRPMTELPAHAHENHAVCLVVSGLRTYRFGRSAFECRAGSAVLVPAGAVHASSFAEQRGRGLMLELLRPDPEMRRLFARPCIWRDAGISRHADSLRHEIWDPGDVTGLALESAAFEVLAASECARADSCAAPRWLETVRDVLHDSFRHPPSLSSIAAAAGVDRSRLTRGFRRHFRMSVAEYVRAIRIREAWDLVACSDLSLCEVAAECGFADQSHLTRAFRRAYATTPGRLRERTAPLVQYMGTLRA
jgi:AraC family transcriptional regulator